MLMDYFYCMDSFLRTSVTHYQHVLRENFTFFLFLFCPFVFVNTVESHGVARHMDLRIS